MVISVRKTPGTLRPANGRQSHRDPRCSRVGDAIDGYCDAVARCSVPLNRPCRTDRRRVACVL